MCPLYLAHDFDLDTPQEETLAAFDALVRAGKVGAVGASNFSAEQLAEALELAALERLPRYEWVQNAFSLLEQGDAQTIFPLCHEHGLGYTPFSPLAGGWLTGKYRRGEEPPAGSRMTQRPEPYEEYVTDRVFTRRRVSGPSRGGARRVVGRARARVGSVRPRDDGGRRRTESRGASRAGHRRARSRALGGRA